MNQLRYVFLALLFLFSAALNAQQRTVTGVVTSSEDGMPLPGATVMVVGTTTGTVTNIDGNYSLQVPGDYNVLRFSFVGMTTVEYEIPAGNVLNVVLEPDTETIEEVVVTALGIRRDRKSLGYSTQSITGADLMQAQEPNLANSLTGKVSGLQIVRSSTGPAGSSQIVLRGHSSLTGDNQPLIIVDGMPIHNFTGRENQDYWNPSLDLGSGIGDINPEDIEDISVLKGASAAALYGSRAGNGVILITTKSGTQRPGLGITVSSSVGFESIFTNPELQNSFGQGTERTYDNLSNMSWGPQIAGQTVENWDGSQITLDAYDNVENYFDLGVNQNHNISFQQQFDATSVYTSVTRREDQSMIPGADLSRTNLLTRAVSSFGPDERWTVDAKVQYLRTEAQNRPLLGHNPSNPFFTMYQLPRSMDIRQFEQSTDEFGNMRWYGGSNQMNPYWIADYRLNNDVRDRFIMHGSVNYQFNDWLTGEIAGGSDIYTTNQEARMFAGSPLSPSGQFSMGKQTFFENNFSYLFSAAQDNVIDRFGVAANFGGNVMMQEFSGLNSSAGQLEVPNLFALNNSTTNPTVSDNFNQKRIMSLYGTLQLNWDGYLFVDGTLRNDWSSTLSPENRSYLYPSVSMSYVFTEMMESMNVMLPDWVTFGRLRASYAEVGNDLGPYELYPFYSIGNDPLGNTTASMGNVLFNPDVRSELIRSLEFGGDLRFFANRLGLDLTWYRTNATRQLINLPMDPLSGFQNMKVNAGNIQNEGLEFVLNGRILQNPNGLNWNTQFNYSTNRNTIVELTEEVTTYQIGGFDNLIILAEAGARYGEIYGTGFLRVEDEASPYYGQKIIDANGFPVMDPQRKRLGSQQPDALMGLTNTFGYRGVTLGFMFDGRFGGEIFSQTNQAMQLMGTAAATAPGGTRENVVAEGVVADGEGSYTPNTTEITQQQYWTVLAGTGNLGITEANIYDATNVRLRYVNLSYDIPGRLLGNLPVQNLRIGATVNNVWLITSHLNGVDPESVYATGTNALGFENSAPPTSRTFLFNLSVSF
jgi:TonB-linked SusC/RagA family outer membrane protein